METGTLLRVKRHIEEYPERFCAANWAWAANVHDVLAFNAAPANFRCCIAGHVLLMAGVFDERALLRHSVSYDDGYLGRRAGETLDLTDVQRRALFYPSQWAEPYRTAYYLAPHRLAEAQAAAGYLEFFVTQALLPATGDQRREPRSISASPRPSRNRRSVVGHQRVLAV